MNIENIDDILDINSFIVTSSSEVGGVVDAVSELKNIATEMSITQKFKSKTVVPIYMKIFASAEQAKKGNIMPKSKNRRIDWIQKLHYWISLGVLLKHDQLLYEQKYLPFFQPIPKRMDTPWRC